MNDIIPPNHNIRIRSNEEVYAEPQKDIAGRRPSRFFRFVLFGIILIAGTALGIVFLKANATLQLVFGDETENVVEEARAGLPVADPREHDRLDILILGIRGEGDPYGGLLTDSLMLASLRTDTGETAIISIPRDTYLEIPIVKKKAKINEAYELGQALDRRGGGLTLAKLAVEEVTGVNIDYAVVVDFIAFKELVKMLGGIEVNVARPLRENLQWGGIDFFVPQGYQSMDAETALYYVRSRFTTSDFDRARRIQEVMFALKNKAISLGFLANPKKIYEALDILGRHVRTDIKLSEITRLSELARHAQTTAVKQLIIDTQGGFLNASVIEGSYVLLPQDGDFSAVKQRVRNIFND